MSITTGINADTKADKAVDYLESSIDPSTKLIYSMPGDDKTTIYKCSLAAMVFLYEGSTSKAEDIFDFFLNVYNDTADDFTAANKGFYKNWKPSTGEHIGSERWEGDTAFLLMALNYYNQKQGSYGDYQDMVDAIVEHLVNVQKTNYVKEKGSVDGAANMFAALYPFRHISTDVINALYELKSLFNYNVNFDTWLDHTSRGALIHGNLNGFPYVDNFAKSQYWTYDTSIEVSTYIPEISYENINNEISSQILLAWKVWESALSENFSSIETEHDKIWVDYATHGKTGETPYNGIGLPYYVVNAEPGWPANGESCYRWPIVDSTVYMYYFYKNFNPFIPGEKCTLIHYALRDAEKFDSATDKVSLEGNKSNAYRENVVQMLHKDQQSSKKTLSYDLSTTLDRAFADPSIRIRYSNEDGGDDEVTIILDNVTIANIDTFIDTGVGTVGWNTFEWSDSFRLNTPLDRGQTAILELDVSHSEYGLMFDIIEITEATNLTLKYMPVSKDTDFACNGYIEAEFKITNNANVRLIANLDNTGNTDYIRLSPGFQVDAGSTFAAQVGF